MSSRAKPKRDPRVDIPAMEADMAFFEARLSLADHAPDTSYQRAQVKTYKTLGKLMGETLSSLKSPARASGDSKNAAA